jgi:hypothetical protein
VLNMGICLQLDLEYTEGSELESNTCNLGLLYKSTTG